MHRLGYVGRTKERMRVLLGQVTTQAILKECLLALSVLGQLWLANRNSYYVKLVIRFHYWLSKRSLRDNQAVSVGWMWDSFWGRVRDLSVSLVFSQTLDGDHGGGVWWEGLHFVSWTFKVLKINLVSFFLSFRFWSDILFRFLGHLIPFIPKLLLLFCLILAIRCKLFKISFFEPFSYYLRDA